MEVVVHNHSGALVDATCDASGTVNITVQRSAEPLPLRPRQHLLCRGPRKALGFSVHVLRQAQRDCKTSQRAMDAARLADRRSAMAAAAPVPATELPEPAGAA